MSAETERNSTPDATDRDDGVRRERRHEGVLLVSVLVALAGWVLLRLELARTADRIALTAAALALAVFGPCRLGLVALAGRGGRDTLVLRHAIREHVDPGLAQQEQADAVAERAATGGGRWIPIVILVGQLAGGRWQHPAVAIPGALLLVAGTAGVVLWYRRWAAVCRRWLADPPGRAPRPRFVLPSDQRPWTISARQGVVLAVLVMVTVSALVAAYRTLG
jgi:hypothetical protein